MTETWRQMTDRHHQERYSSLKNLADRGVDRFEASEILGLKYCRLTYMAKDQGINFRTPHYMGGNGMKKRAAVRFDKLNDGQKVDYGTFRDAGYCTADALRAVGRADLIEPLA